MQGFLEMDQLTCYFLAFQGFIKIIGRLLNVIESQIFFISGNRMYKSYRMSNTEQVATVGPQMVAGIRYRNEVAATSHNHTYRAAWPGLR